MNRGSTRILFVVLPERGHLNPLLGVARAIASAGHQIAFFCHDDISAQLQLAGLSGPFACVAGTPDPANHRIADLNRLANVRWLKQWAKFGIRAVLTPRIIDPLRALVRSFRPDAICLDPLAYHGVVVAETEHIPWAGLSTNLLPLAPSSWDCPMVEIYRELAGDRDELLAQYAVTARFKVNEAISPWLNTVFTTEAFVPRVCADNDYSFFVGPVSPHGARGDETAFPWSRLPDHGPIVYVSFGSQISYPEPFTAELLVELSRDAHVVVGLKDLFDRLAPQLPGRVTAVRYAPQLALLDRVDVMVTHGGANSVMEALSKGRPMLVVPSVNDGPLQGLFVERAQVGASVPLATATASGCRDRVQAMLPNDSQARRRAVEIGRSYAAKDGAAHAARLVIHLAHTREPQRPPLARMS